MEKAKKYFGEYEMTWKRVIVFAVITAVITAVLNLIPALSDTSFQDIAIVVDCWFLFAMFVIMNCKTWKEAAIKTFVFFLISQPLIYLIEVPFNPMGWELFGYYGYWFKLTVLTLPGAAIAFLVKKKNWLSVAVLSVATAYLAYASVNYFYTVLARFPHHLLSCIFCAALALFFIFAFLDEKKHRIAALAIFAIVLIACAIVCKPVNVNEIDLDEGDWTYTVSDESVVTVEEIDGDSFKLKAKGEGSTIITFKNTDGTVVEYSASVSGGGIYTDLID